MWIRLDTNLASAVPSMILAFEVILVYDTVEIHARETVNGRYRGQFRQI